MSSFKDLLNQENTLENEDVSFADAMRDIKPLTQDKIHFAKLNNKQNNARASIKNVEDRTADNKPLLNRPARFHFSDQYEPLIDEHSTLSFTKEGTQTYYTKLLRRGDIRPEVILDLHGYTKEQAKFDLAELIADCKAQHIACACVVHGVGGGILKKKIPHYLMQHPDVAAFHQAPLEWGGQGAILILVDLGEELEHKLLR
ncbi:MAG: endonuclease SmrB [Gammaproteobacteria bacterium]|nr:endonuclease SmrB [Gammaproteobacteria bacterium]